MFFCQILKSFNIFEDCNIHERYVPHESNQVNFEKMLLGDMNDCFKSAIEFNAEKLNI